MNGKISNDIPIIFNELAVILIYINKNILILFLFLYSRARRASRLILPMGGGLVGWMVLAVNEKPPRELTLHEMEWNEKEAINTKLKMKKVSHCFQSLNLFLRNMKYNGISSYFMDKNIFINENGTNSLLLEIVLCLCICMFIG